MKETDRLTHQQDIYNVHLGMVQSLLIYSATTSTLIQKLTSTIQNTWVYATFSNTTIYRYQSKATYLATEKVTISLEH